MTINETGLPGGIRPTPMAPRVAAPQPVSAPAAPSGGAPAVADAPVDTGAVERLQAAAGGPAAAGMPWDAVKSTKSVVDTLRDRLGSQHSWSSRATVAASTLGVTNAIGKGSRAADQIANGNVAVGTANMAAAVADGTSAAMSGLDAARGTSTYRSMALRLKVSGNIAGSFTGIVRGAEEMRNGDTLTGATRIAGSAASGASAAISVAGMIAGKDSALGGAAGRLAAPLGVVGGLTDGAIGMQRGVGQMLEGNVLEGAATAGRGALDAAASGSYMASVIPSGSQALQTFGRAAGPLGAAAGAVAGGVQVYNAINTDPPDVEAAVLGGAKAAGSAMLMLPPPGNVAGGAVLVGAALYENREAIGNFAVSAGTAVAGAASDAATAVVDVASDAVSAVGSAASSAASAVGDAASSAANAVADGASNAAKSVGNFFSGLF
ncbi:hypothetical protein D3C72_698310 [compost metagenome]